LDEPIVQAHHTGMNIVAEELENIIAGSVPRLSAIGETDASSVPGPGKWSKKQELGHLIDSAVNNHIRFVRLQLENRLELPGYQQEEWIRVERYQDRLWQEIVATWEIFNRNIAWIIRHVDTRCLRNLWRSPEGTDVDLEFVIRDYVVHLRHHLDHVLS
jgi:hypothetical protein